MSGEERAAVRFENVTKVFESGPFGCVAVCALDRVNLSIAASEVLLDLSVQTVRARQLSS